MHTAPKVPVIRLTRMPDVPTLEIMETDLERIDALYADESQALGFASASLGVFATVGVSWLASGHLSPASLAVHAAITATSGPFTAWFGVTWLRARRARPRLIQKLTQKPLRAVTS